MLGSKLHGLAMKTYQNGFGDIKKKTTPVEKQTLKGWMVITRRMTVSGPAYFATY